MLGIGLALALTLVLTGCMVLPTEGTMLVSDVNQLKLDVKRLKEQAQDTNKMQASWQESSRETEKAHFEQLRDRLIEVSLSLEKLEKEVALLRQAQAGQAPSSAGGPVRAEGDFRSTMVTTGGLTVSAKDLFRSATELLVREKYEEAMGQFRSLIQQFPDSDLADDALFGVGECLHAMDKPGDAIEAYLSIAKRYPASDRLADANYRAAMCAKQQGDRSRAAALLEEIVVKYPAYEEMGRVKDALAELRTQ